MCRSRSRIAVGIAAWQMTRSSRQASHIKWAQGEVSLIRSPSSSIWESSGDKNPTRGHIATAILRDAANLQPKHQLHCGLHKIFFFPKLKRLKLGRVLSLLVARTNRNTTHGSWYCFDNVRSAFCKHYFARAHEIQSNCRLNSQKILAVSSSLFMP